MIKKIFLALILIVIFSGCSSKQYFEPEKSIDYDFKIYDTNSTIISLNSDGATLENNNIISEKGIISVKRSDFDFINLNQDDLILADNNSTLMIKNISNSKDPLKLSFKNNIISASKKDDLLAIGFADNSIMLYDLKTKKTLFKEYLKHSFINNTKTANPIFLKSVVLYPTLDGKVVIVDINKKSIIQSINIDPSNDINNIIFLKEINNALVIASTNILFTFVDGKVNKEELYIKSIILNDTDIYVATLDGQVIKYDLSLNKISSTKLKFANIHTLGYGSSLYALESQEYLIKFSDDLNNYSVYPFSFDEEQKSIAIKNKIYFDDKYIILN
jgi:hypothetical protein